MTIEHPRHLPQACASRAAALAVAVGMAAGAAPAKAAEDSRSALEESFAQQVRPFLAQNCVLCHNEDTAMSGVRLDQLDAALEDRHLRLWEAVERNLTERTMPPEGAPQPSDADRQRMVGWVGRALDAARRRPVPKNGLVRRLTVPQYRNALRELLQLEDDLTDILPPDAVSQDGFVNNAATLELSPLLMETYFEIAEEALSRSFVDPDSKPTIQSFRVDLGAGVNPEPLPGKLILGANSLLLDNRDYLVKQTTPSKPFAFEPHRMRTQYRFIEGYKGNATVRGWRDFDSIYHAVFACMRGSRGYPKGEAYGSVPEGLLLRPAIPNEELFGQDGTYGPKANFKISLRELPDHGRFRVTVTAAKYDDGLLLNPGTPAQPAGGPRSVQAREPAVPQSVTIERSGVYQVDIHEASPAAEAFRPDPSRLGEGLIGFWPLDGTGSARLQADARYVESPFGQGVDLDGYDDAVTVPRSAETSVGQGDFTVAIWIRPKQLRRAGIMARGANGATGWYLDLAGNKGDVRIETAGPDNEPNGTVASPPGIIRPRVWQHVAAVVRRGGQETQLYVNGHPVARGEIGAANLDNPELELHIGRIPGQQEFLGQLDEARLYRRALGEAELRALVEPGRQFAEPPPSRPQDVALTLGTRQFSGTLTQPAFLAVRLPAGPLAVRTENRGVRDLDRIVLTPLPSGHAVERKFLAFEERSPQLGVHLGLRRDCGSTFAPVGPPQAVAGTELQRFRFEGAMRDFPSPDVEKDNVNYLAGIREIGVRSEYTDGRDMPRLLIRSVEFEGPLYETWPPAPHRSVFVDFDRKSDAAAYAREILRSFAARAFRRPASAEEESTLLAVFREALADGRSFRDSVQDALVVALTSPQFLFLVEASETPAPEPIGERELASKLAFFLWNGPPDSATLDLASAGALRQRLPAEVRRMVADPRFDRFVGEFAAQWLSLDKFDVLEPDRKLFPRLTRDVRAQLRREPAELLLHMLRKNRPVRELIQSDYVLANEVVATYYGLGESTESGFEFVPIQHGRPELGGVLTQAAVLAGLSDGREPNPVKRGAWLARKIVAEPPDDPPPNVPDLEADTEGLPLRERLQMHRSQPGCMQCHTKIDPWGVPFEEFDAGGRLQPQPVDARSQLPDGTEVSGVNELKRYLSEERIDQVAFSVLKHLATYATGRTLTYNELDFLQRDSLRLKADGYGMQDLLQYVATSKLFLEK